MDAYAADSSLKGKLRRRLVRLACRKPARVRLERPIVSISFDDAPASAACEGARLLESRGLRGTWFISAGLAGKTGPMGRNADAGEIEALIASGHEIGCHTHTHIDCGQASGEEVSAELTRNRAAIVGLGAPEPRTFAYPYGDVALPAKALADSQFALARALHHGLISDGSDLNQAPAVGIEGPAGEAIARRWLDEALNRKAWLILYTHDVGQTPSLWGCSPDTLARLLDRALEGGAEVLTVSDGCRRIGAI